MPWTGGWVGGWVGGWEGEYDDALTTGDVEDVINQTLATAASGLNTTAVNALPYSIKDENAARSVRILEKYHNDLRKQVEQLLARLTALEP
jgi:hypothetical protein